MEPTDTTTQQLMFSLIEIWKSSGLTQQEFCKEKDLAYHRFHYWYKKYNNQHASSDIPARAAFSRVSIKGSGNHAGGGAVEVVYPNGCKIVFNQAVDASFLRSLLS